MMTSSNPVAAFDAFRAKASERIVATRIYPDPKMGLTLPRFLELSELPGQPEGRREWNALTSACEHAVRLSATPIVGVCGTINSGKSTVVASFLSAQDRRRVLIGQLGKEGTHRFIFWLPEAWRSSGASDEVIRLLQNLTDTTPEFLSEDPATAAAQYNAREDRIREFNMPLIAFDASLNEKGIAFLDCPDIQRSFDEASPEFTSGERTRRLRSIAPVCSAFILVTSMQQLESETPGIVFKMVSEAASEAPLYLVLNMTQSGNAELYREELQRAVRRWDMSGQFKGAFFAPYLKSESNEAVFPDFHSLNGGAETLTSIRSQLNPAELQQKFLASCVTALESYLGKLRISVDKASTENSKIASELEGKINRFIQEKFISPAGDLRAISYNDAARQMAESIQRTAPAVVRIAQAPGNWLKSVLGNIKKRSATKDEEEKYAHVEAGVFASFMLGHSALPPGTTHEELEQIWNSARDKAITIPPPGFANQEELDKLTSNLWKELPTRDKFRLYRNIAMALAGFTIVGALVPIDGGATLVLWSKFHMVLGGWEILAITVGGPLAGTLMTLPAAKAVVRKLESQIAKPQISFLYAALLDRLGVPRSPQHDPVIRSSAGVEFTLTRVEPNVLPPALQPLKTPWIQTDDAGWNDLIATLKALRP